MFMRQYSFIIIDEVHNRSMLVDNTLYYIKKLLQRNWDKPECPFIILTSATFDPKIFMDYFECPKENFLDVAGSTHPIIENFFHVDLSDYITYIVDLIEKIHIDNINDIISNSLFRDILVFVQGKAQINEITSRIHKLNAEVFSQGIIASQIHSIEQWKKYKIGGAEKRKVYYIAPVAVMSADIQMGGIEYKNLFSNIETVSVNIYKFDEKGEITDEVLQVVPASRRVMIGTNAIETGMTIDTLKYCIDSGFVKQSEFNPNYGCNILLDKNITQANTTQRKGRVGRLAPGEFYAAYTKEVFNHTNKIPYPDIVKEDISGFLLGVIVMETEMETIHIDISERTDNSFQMNQFDQNWYNIEYKNVFDASVLDFIQYPSSDSLGYGLEKLHGLGFIDHEYKPTLFGYYATKFRKLKLENIRMIFAGYQYGANILDLITIACCLEVGIALGIKKNKYVPRNPLSVSENESFLYYKMLFSDEFVEYIFIWHDFMKTVESVGNQMETIYKSKKKTTLSIHYVENWCKTNHFNIGGLYSIIELRDDILNDMLSMGLDPYYNGLNLPRGTYNLVDILNRNMEEGMEEIRKIKKSIYEGYRFNLLIWDARANSYISNYFHEPVSVYSKIINPLMAGSANDEVIKQTKPQKIIVSNIVVIPSFKHQGLFEFSGGDVSVLDGFVDVDVDFLLH
jgi:HrpA-like RNA helicase